MGDIVLTYLQDSYLEVSFYSFMSTKPPPSPPPVSSAAPPLLTVTSYSLIPPNPPLTHLPPHRSSPTPSSASPSSATSWPQLSSSRSPPGSTEWASTTLLFSSAASLSHSHLLLCRCWSGERGGEGSVPDGIDIMQGSSLMLSAGYNGDVCG